MALHPSVAAVRLAVRRCLTAQALIDQADASGSRVVVVACSGGADSIALLSATVHEGHKAGWHVAGVTVDHGLQEGSAAVADAVVARMATIGADETVAVRVAVEAAGLGPEAAAREARYAVLHEVAQRLSAAAVLLGHTRDDQAETVLLGLARGSGGRSLAGMRRSYGVYYRRPLLDVARADTVTACQVEGLVIWEDPHNADPAYLRSRVRTRVLPVLEEELGPGVAAALARTADQLRVDAEHLDNLADDVVQGLGQPPTVAELVKLPTAVRRRVLRLLAIAAGAPPAEVFHEHVLAVDALLTDWHGQKWVDLPGHVRAVRRDGRLLVGRKVP